MRSPLPPGRRWHLQLVLCVALAPFVGCENDTSTPADPAPVATLGAAYAQTKIAYLTGFPRLPAPFVVRDWKATAKAYDA
jgi:hypothetical protein